MRILKLCHFLRDDEQKNGEKLILFSTQGLAFRTGGDETKIQSPTIPLGDSVALLVKCWPTELAVLRPCSRRNLLNPKLGSIAHSLSLSSAHGPDMTEILLERL